MKYLVFAVAMFVAANAPANPLPDFPFVIVAEEITKKVTPDYCELSFYSIAFEKTSKEAMEKINQVSLDVLELLEAHEIPNSALFVSSMDKRAKQSRSAEQRALEILGYEASQTFQLRIDDLEKYPEFVSQLMEVDHISGFDPMFRVENEAQHRITLLAELSKKARKLADELASQQSRKVKKLYGITTAKNFSYAVGVLNLQRGSILQPLLTSASVDYDRPLVFTVPGTIEIRQVISAVYELK